MYRIQYVWSAPVSESAEFSLPPLTCELPRRRRLRHYIVGTPEDAQMAIDRLHLLHYAERFEWTRPLQIPQNGILINTSAGEVLRFLQRDSRIDAAGNE
ncbi:MAG: hypothetical protein OHK0037_36290 [Elainellaceae cyanobacterium]